MVAAVVLRRIEQPVAEFSGKFVGNKSQPLATFPRPVCDDVVRLSEADGFMYPKRGILRGPGSGDCYGELP